jgi:hypothetical protein
MIRSGQGETNDKGIEYESNREASKKEQESRAGEKARAQEPPYVGAQPHSYVVGATVVTKF